MIGRMRAVQVLTPTGPADVVVREVDEPVPGEHDVLVDVHAFGVSFPDLLLSKGLYQMRPEPPFTLGIDVAGTVVSGPGLEPGQRVAGVVPYGGASERALVPAVLDVRAPRLARRSSRAAALPMNYLTAHFALVERGDLRAGETVLVHGAAGGVGTASASKSAKGFGARVVAVTSTQEKAEYARAVGADDAVLLEGFKDAVGALTEGPRRRRGRRRRGRRRVHRLAAHARHAGPAAGGRLRRRPGHPGGQGEPAAAEQHRRARRGLGRLRDEQAGGYMQQQWAALLPLLEAGAIDPPIGATYDLDGFGRALQDMDDRLTLGKSVVRVR